LIVNAKNIKNLNIKFKFLLEDLQDIWN